MLVVQWLVILQSNFLAAYFSEIEVLTVGWSEGFFVCLECLFACSAPLSNDELHPQIFV